VVVAVVLGSWLMLADLAYQARQNEGEEAVKGPIGDDYGNATKWAKELLGIASTLAGFLGIAAASQKEDKPPAADRVRVAEGGTLGVLAGSSLLGVGGWVMPAALAVLVAGGVTVRTVRAIQEGRAAQPGSPPVAPPRA